MYVQFSSIKCTSYDNIHNYEYICLDKIYFQ